MEEGRSSRDNLYADECGPRFFFSPPPLPPSLIIVFFTFFASSESSSLAKRISGIGARPEERNTSRLDRFEITVGLSTERKRYSNVVHPVTFVATSHATKFNLIIFYLGTWCYVARRVLLTLFYNSVYNNYRNKELLVVARRRGRDGGGDRGRDGEFKVRARVLGKEGVVYVCVGNYTLSPEMLSLSVITKAAAAAEGESVAASTSAFFSTCGDGSNGSSSSRGGRLPRDRKCRRRHDSFDALGESRSPSRRPSVPCGKIHVYPRFFVLVVWKLLKVREKIRPTFLAGNILFIGIL